MADSNRQVSIFINGKEVENSINAISTAKRALLREINNTTIGEQEYLDKVKELNKVNDIVAQHTSAIRGTTSAWGSLTPAVQNFLSVSAGLFSVTKIIEFGKSALIAANNIEQVNVAFTTMLGSKDKADELQAQLITLANNTPFELIQVQDATKRLLAFGFTAEQIIPTLNNLGNIASGVGMDKLPNLILALGQVKAAGHLMGQELRQFTEAGVPLLDEIGKVLHKTSAEVKLMVEEGKVGFPTVQKALEGMSSEGGRFFNLMEKQSKTLGGLFSTFKDTFTQGVLLPIGNSLASLAKPLLDFGINVGNTLIHVTDASDKLTASTQKMQGEFNTEIEILKNGNFTQKERSGLITEINKKYGEYLPNLLSEKASIEEITKAQRSANDVFLQKIIWIAGEKEFQKILDKGAKTASASLAAEKSRVESQKKLSGELGDVRLLENTRYEQGLKDQAKFSGLMRDVNQKILKDDIPKELEEFQKRMEDFAARFGTTWDKMKEKFATKQAVDLPMIDPKELKKAEEALERLREKVKAFENESKESGEAGIEKEIEKVVAKYAKEIHELEDFKKKHASKTSEANDLEQRLYKLQTTEVGNIVTRGLKAIEDKEKEFSQSAEDRLKDKETKEIEAINDKYDKEIKIVTVLENDTAHATEEQRTKAHALHLKLDKDRELDIINLKEKNLAEQQAKDAEGNAKFIEEQKKLNDEYFALINRKPVKLKNKKGEDDDDEVIERLRKDAQESIAIETKKYDTQIKLEGDAADRVVSLEKKKAENIKAINEKLSADIIKVQKKTISETIKQYQELGSSVGEIFVTLGDLIAGETAKNQNIQKIAALAKLAIDTAVAIAGIVASAAVPPSDPISMAIKIAAGTAIVLTNIARARSIIEAVPQKDEGGYHQVRGASDGKVYNAKAEPDFGGGFVTQPTLVGEQIEYTIPRKLLDNPLVANFIPIIEAIRTNRGVPVTRQRDAGGFTDTYNNTAKILSGTNQNTQSLFPNNEDILSELRNIATLLTSGKVVAVVTSEGAYYLQRQIDLSKKIQGF